MVASYLGLICIWNLGYKLQILKHASLQRSLTYFIQFQIICRKCSIFLKAVQIWT